MAVINKRRRVVTVLRVLLIVVAIVLVLLWFLAGGAGKIADLGSAFRFTSIADILSGSTTLSNFELPGAIAPPAIPVTAVSQTSGEAQPGAGSSYGGSYGAPSPYAGHITLADGAAQTQAASGQYVELDAAPGNSGPIDISGWTLESPLTDSAAVLPQAALVFVQGEINAVADVFLAPGSRATVVSGPSPVGVSFEENKCTGYLGTLQPFVPPLPQACPSPLSSIPNTQANEARLGGSCFAYLASLPPCTFPANPPGSLTSACRAEIQTTLTYNGCVRQYKADEPFATGSWRLYLAHGLLWAPQHDVVRLLDAQGRVVDVINY